MMMGTAEPQNLGTPEPGGGAAGGGWRVGLGEERGAIRQRMRTDKRIRLLAGAGLILVRFMGCEAHRGGYLSKVR